MSTLKEIIQLRTPRPRFAVLQPMQRRFSPRVYANESVRRNDLKVIFEAVRLTASARNHQPWLFYWMRQGSDAYEQLISCMPERNLWVKTAPVMIMACYSLEEPKDGTNRWALYDLGQAVNSLVLQANDLGYYCRQIGSFDLELARERLHVQEPYKPFITIALGKIGTKADYEQASEEIIKKELTVEPRRETVAIELS